MSSRPEAFSHFLAVRDGERKPRFTLARRMALESAPCTWESHAAAMSQFKNPEEKDNNFSEVDPENSLLNLKIALAHQVMASCDLCPHHCFVDRTQGQRGYCGVGNASAVHWEGILHGEELELVPSHEVFLSGCTMRCAFCFAHEHITKPMSGVEMSPIELAGCATKRYGQGATNLNLVGGEPIVHIENILKALKHIDQPIPIVWNSNMYATEVTMDLLDGIVDLYLGDIHFGNDSCAKELGRIPNYLGSITQSFRMAVDSGASVIIRHLVMPGHLECCTKPALEWAATHFPDVPFHLMFQYTPDYRAIGDPVLGRTLTKAEKERALQLADELGVSLYNEPSKMNSNLETGGICCDDIGIGDSIDILVHADGQVTFTRLSTDMLPVAMALNGGDSRLLSRGGTI